MQLCIIRLLKIKPFLIIDLFFYRENENSGEKRAFESTDNSVNAKRRKESRESRAGKVKFTEFVQSKGRPRLQFKVYTIDSADNKLNGTFKYRSLYPKFTKSLTDFWLGKFAMKSHTCGGQNL
jgi:hypothetical protein